MRAAIAGCLILLLSGTALAQPVEPDTAAALQHNLRGWLAGMLGTVPAAPTQRLRITPAGDHFQVALPIGSAAAEINASVRPLPDHRWAIDAIHLPPVSDFTVRRMAAGGGDDAMAATRLDVHIGGQQAHALIDPALTGASQLSVALTNVDLAADRGRWRQMQHVGRYTLQAALQPDRGQLDLLEDSSITGFRSASRAADRPAVGFGADRIQGSARINGIDRSQALALLNAIGGLLFTLPPAAAASSNATALPEPQQAMLHRLVESLRGNVTTVQGHETFYGLHIARGGLGEISMPRASLDIAGTASGGRLQATLSIDLNGLAVTDLPAPAAALLPRHLTVQPKVTGAPLAALTTLALAATEPRPNNAELRADEAALWAQGGMTVGFDALEADIGPVALHGYGSVRIIGPQDYQAHARIIATGFDLLMRQAIGDPDLQQALPLLALARGVARPEGDQLVWDIVANGAGLTVNDIPLGGRPQAARR